MRKSSIHFDITLDKNNYPDKIKWNATDNPNGHGLSETTALNISLWDPEQKHSMRIDLWTKDMPVEEMKKFYIDMIGGMSQSILNATGDTFISKEIKQLADKLAQHLIDTAKNQ